MVFVFSSVLGSNLCMALRGTCISCASYCCRMILPYSVRRAVRHAFSTIKLFCSHADCVSVGDLSTKMQLCFLPLGRCKSEVSFATVVKQLVLPGMGQGSKCCSIPPSEGGGGVPSPRRYADIFFVIFHFLEYMAWFQIHHSRYGMLPLYTELYRYR